jgi:hypothetical protein
MRRRLTNLARILAPIAILGVVALAGEAGQRWG